MSFCFIVVNINNCIFLTYKLLLQEGNKSCFLDAASRPHNTKILNASCKVTNFLSFFWIFSEWELRALIISQDVLNSSQVMGWSSSKVSTATDCTLAEILEDTMQHFLTKMIFYFHGSRQFGQSSSLWLWCFFQLVVVVVFSS